MTDKPVPPAESQEGPVEIPAEIAEDWARIREGAEELIPERDWVDKLVRSRREKRPLRVKLGCDPSSPDLHIGHSVVLRKLREFQDMGHRVVFIIGDATGRIGDPTGRSETRPQLTEQQVKANADTYFQQVFRILDEAKTEIAFNSQWFRSLTFEDAIRLLAQMTVARMLERDDFEKRHAAGHAIHLHEFLYPLMQGYDSIMVRADIEAGGTDQKFNLLVGRDLQREAGQEPQVILTMPLLVGLDGKNKMSKSLGNQIGICEPPDQIFGKAMSITDEMMEEYYRLALGYPTAEARRLMEECRAGTAHPRDLKARLARELTARYHSEAAAREAEKRFNRVHRERERPEEMEELRLRLGSDGKLWICEALVQAELSRSNGEARRLIRQGGLKIDGQRVDDEMLELGRGSFDVQAGRRRFLKITLT
ncbi:MAG: tyrosine--tRNA ligase [Candidatus Sumerlaeota bacterium]|nr:tyrosine--tRNA ligase [Candidatus Sumerlaeota bacterium]